MNRAVAFIVVVAVLALLVLSFMGESEQTASVTHQQAPAQQEQVEGSLGRVEASSKVQGLDGMSVKRDEGTVGHNIEGNSVKGLTGLSIDEESQ